MDISYMPQVYSSVTTYELTRTSVTPSKGSFPGLPRWAGTRKKKPIWILLKQETVAVALAGPYASLHLAPDR